MFITTTSAGYKGTEQFCNGLFLVIVEDPFSKVTKSELRGVVRPVKMRQLGHWMMGDLKIGGFTIALSGTYGSDGLPLSLRRHFIGVGEDKKAQFKDFTEDEKRQLWDKMIPLPPDLHAAFWAGGGHNDAGKEGPAIYQWAQKNLKELKKKW